MIAMTVINAQKANATFQPKPSDSDRGMLMAEPMEANKPIEAVYKLVIRPIFCGKLNFTTAGRRTLQIAIPTPTKAVPAKIAMIDSVERMKIPAVKMIKAAKMDTSFPKRIPILGAANEKTANDKRGIEVSMPAALLVIPVVSLIIGTSGPTDVMAGLKLKAINNIPAIKKYCET